MSLLPTPGHLYLGLTARSWSRTLRGWQVHLPWLGLVISQVPNRLPPTCSFTPMLLPQECCECRSFLPACAPAGLQRGNRALALSVLRLQCGASSHWFVILRLWVVLADRCLGLTHAQQLDLPSTDAHNLSLVQHARINSGPLHSTLSCTDSLRSLLQLDMSSKELSFSSSPTGSFLLSADVSLSKQPLLPLSISQSANSFHCHWCWYLVLWTAPAATGRDVLAATGSDPHSKPQFSTVRCVPDRIGLLGKPPASSAFLLSRASSRILAFLRSNTNTGMKQYECGRTQPLLCMGHDHRKLAVET
jgi:hypothetical protein